MARVNDWLILKFSSDRGEDTAPGNALCYDFNTNELFPAIALLRRARNALLLAVHAAGDGGVRLSTVSAGASVSVQRRCSA